MDLRITTGKSAGIIGALLFILVSTATNCALAGDQVSWNFVQNKYFRALSDAPPADVRNLLTDLDRFRLIVQKFATVTIPPDAPPTDIVIFANGSDYREYVPSVNIDAFTVRGKGHRSLIVMPLVTRDDNRHDMRHEYVHSLLAYHRLSLPHWYEEGLAEFLSAVIIRDNNEIIIGRAPKDRVDALNYASEYSYDKLIDDDFNPVGTSFGDAYAQYWLLTHYITVNSKRTRELGKYIALYNSGMDSMKAFKMSFGMTPDELYRRKLRTYMHHMNAYLLKFDFSGSNTDFKVSPASFVTVSDMRETLDHVHWGK